MDLTCDEEMLGDSPALDTTLKAEPPLENMNFNTGEMSPAFVDPALVKDPRVLQYMLKMEEKLNAHSFCYFKMLQTDILPEMRSSVTTWMYEVCEEECLPDNVFLLSVNYLDRFLTVNKIERSQFQLLGAVCLLIASKWVGTVLTLEKLIFYTANSITRAMILNWEMMVLCLFKWDTFALTPHDFVEQILYRLPDNLWNATNVRQKVKTYVSYCSTGPAPKSLLWKTLENALDEIVFRGVTHRFRELKAPAWQHFCPLRLLVLPGESDHNFRIHLPSMIASASIAAAIGTQVTGDVLQEVLHHLHVITNIETDVLRTTMDQIRLAVQLATMEAMGNCENPGDNRPGISGDSMDRCGLDKLGELGQAETPTDVGDIHF